MRRRDVLAVLGSVAAAGCTGSPAAGGGDGTTDGTTRTTTDRPSVAGTSFEVTGTRCGAVAETATVAVGDGSVSVTGTTSETSACYTATLESATYDAAADELRVVVAAVVRDETDACAQCLTEIEYEAGVAVDGGLPGRVVVVHRSRGEERVVASTET